MEETKTKQLAELRLRWLEAKRSGDTKGMKIIELRAKLLKMNGEPKNTIELAEEVFGV